MKRLKYRLACWLVGYDIQGAIEVARLQGNRAGRVHAFDSLMHALNAAEEYKKRNKKS